MCKSTQSRRSVKGPLCANAEGGRPAHAESSRRKYRRAFGCEVIVFGVIEDLDISPDFPTGSCAIARANGNLHPGIVHKGWVEGLSAVGLGLAEGFNASYLLTAITRHLSLNHASTGGFRQTPKGVALAGIRSVTENRNVTGFRISPGE